VILFTNRPKYSQPENQNLLKEFCFAFNDTVDKSQLTLEQAAMYVCLCIVYCVVYYCMLALVHLTYSVYILMILSSGAPGSLKSFSCGYVCMYVCVCVSTLEAINN